MARQFLAISHKLRPFFRRDDAIQFTSQPGAHPQRCAAVVSVPHPQPPAAEHGDCAVLIFLHARIGGARGHMAENDGDHSCILSAGRSTQQDGAVGEYLRMQERFNEVGAEASATGGAALVCVPGTSAEKLERWAARRACWRWGRYPPPGHAENTLLALRTAHTQVVLCRRAGCAALVDMQAARRRARAAGRDVFEIGDGCAGPQCSVRPWPQRFARRQASMAKALGVGSRMLMLWPPSTAARQDQWAVPPWLAAAIAVRGRGGDGRRNRGGGSVDSGTDDEDDEGLGGDKELDESMSKQGQQLRGSHATSSSSSPHDQ